MATESHTSDGIRDSDRGGPYVAAVRWVENRSETQFAYLLLTPPLLLLGAIALWPLLSTFRMSLFADSLSTGGLGEFVFVQNYVDIITGEKSALMPAPFLPNQLTVQALFQSALTVTLVLDQDFRGRRWVRVAIIIPWAIPIVIQGMIFFLLFQPGIGLFTGTPENPSLLQELGLISFTPLANTIDATMIVIVADIWKTSAFMALLILAGLQSVNRDLYDVAKVAGATKWQQFKLITFPLILPTIGIAVLFRSVQAMRVYGIIDTVSKCEVVPSLSCMVVSTFLTRQGTSAAIAFVTAAIIGIAVSVIIYQQYKEGI